jgi:carbon-monoxide dehydrogenase medium subunit
VKPSAFDYAKPSTLDDAFAILADQGDEATILAGGQSLIATLNMRLSQPGILVDINGIEELSGISVLGGTLRIGALTRHFEIEQSAEIAKHAPLIAEAVQHVAHPAIRNRGTFGGSIAMADPAAEYPACVCALGGEIEIAGSSGRRKVAAGDFFKGLYDIDLQPGEIVSAIEMPVIADGEQSFFAELARRHGDYAMVGIAAHAKVSGGTLSNARLVFFGVGGTPVSAKSAANCIDGKGVDDALIAEAQSALDQDLEPFDDVNCGAATKMHLAKQLLGQCLTSLGQD